MSEATRRSQRRILRVLQRIGPPPHTATQLWDQRMCLQQLAGNLDAVALWRTNRALFAGPEGSWLDLPRTIRGFRFSLDAMWDEVSHVNLAHLAPRLDVPVHLLLGRKDHWVPPATSMAYLDALEAPAKEVVWFEHSGHEPFVDEPERFNRAMLRVRDSLP